MAEFTRIGGAYFRQNQSGEMYAVSDPDTLKGLKTGQLPFNSVENTRGLSFSPGTSTSLPENTKTPDHMCFFLPSRCLSGGIYLLTVDSTISRYVFYQPCLRAVRPHMQE